MNTIQYAQGSHFTQFYGIHLSKQHECEESSGGGAGRGGVMLSPLTHSYGKWKPVDT